MLQIVLTSLEIVDEEKAPESNSGHQDRRALEKSGQPDMDAVIIDMRVSVPGKQLLKMCQLQQLLSATRAEAGGPRGGNF